MASSKFIEQNRYFLTILMLEFCTLIVLFFVLAPALVDSSWYWKQQLFATSDEFSPDRTRQSIELLTTANAQLKTQIDSLRKVELSSKDDDLKLAFLRNTAAHHQVFVTNFHVDPDLRENQKHLKEYALEVHGKYHQLGEFINGVERSSLRFKVISLNLRGSQSGSGQLEGRVELVSE